MELSDTTMGDLEQGDGVLLRFESAFGDKPTQSFVGKVAAAKESEAVVDTEDGERFVVSWTGEIRRRIESGAMRKYGFDGRVYTLDRVDPIKGLDVDEVHENDRPAEDPFLEE